MPGKTGKRSKAPKPCGACGLEVKGDFMREPKADFHEGCWWAAKAATAIAIELEAVVAQGGNNISISCAKYHALPEDTIKAIAGKLPAGWTARDEGFLGYILFRKESDFVKGKA